MGKRVKPISSMQSWGDVDRAVMRIGEIQAATAQIEAELTAQVEALKEDAKLRVTELSAEQKLLAKDVETFCKEHRDALTQGAKSLTLAHGTVGWRASSALKLGLTVEATIEKLLEAGLAACVKVTKTIDKVAVKALAEEQLSVVGAKLERKDEFYIEPAITRVPAAP